MAYLQITMTIKSENRAAAEAVYTKYKQPFLETIQGAASKELLVRDEDVQVLHGFDNVAHAQAYLDSDLFKDDVATELAPFFEADPQIRVYDVA